MVHSGLFFIISFQGIQVGRWPSTLVSFPAPGFWRSPKQEGPGDPLLWASTGTGSLQSGAAPFASEFEWCDYAVQPLQTMDAAPPRENRAPPCPHVPGFEVQSRPQPQSRRPTGAHKGGYQHATFAGGSSARALPRMPPKKLSRTPR